MWPILITQISLHSMTVVDTMMSGRAGTEDLAGVAVGSGIWMPPFLLITGILMAVTPSVAQFVGSGQRERIPQMVVQSIYMSIALSLLFIGVGAVSLEPILQLLSLDEAVHHIAKHYLIGLSFGIIPLFITSVLRNFFDAQGYTKISMIILLLAVPVNVVLNYVLIFGAWGFPRLGGIGAGYATAITYGLMMLLSILFTICLPSIRNYRLFSNWVAPSWRIWRELLAIGIPIGLSIFSEASIFSVVTLLMSAQFDTVTIAANQAAFTFAGIMFMMPLSISMALTILVGFEVGAKRFKDAAQYAKLGVLSAIGVITIAVILLYFNRDTVAYLYTRSDEVAFLIMQFLIFVIFFQLSDAAQAALQGILRGFKDVTVPFIIAFTSYWIIGIPSGYLLANYTELGPFGYWVGITIGLSCAAVGFGARLAKIYKVL
jgi:MATE family multidrug resistance protein